MRIFKSYISLLLILICVIPTASAQQGHPLVGSWLGNWESGQNAQNYLTIIIYWDGENISGIVNPGPDSSTLQNANFYSSTWTFSFETDLEDNSGDIVHFVGEGLLEDVGSQTRTLTGVWNIEGSSGDFILTRQNGG